jgi:hypothetical protein
MSKDDSLKGRFVNRALKQAFNLVRVHPLIEQEGHEYRQARSIKVLDLIKLNDNINPTYNY